MKEVGKFIREINQMQNVYKEINDLENDIWDKLVGESEKKLVLSDIAKISVESAQKWAFKLNKNFPKEKKELVREIIGEGEYMKSEMKENVKEIEEIRKRLKNIFEEIDDILKNNEFEEKEEKIVYLNIILNIGDLEKKACKLTIHYLNAFKIFKQERLRKLEGIK